MKEVSGNVREPKRSETKEARVTHEQSCATPESDELFLGSEMSHQVCLQQASHISRSFHLDFRLFLFLFQLAKDCLKAGRTNDFQALLSLFAPSPTFPNVKAPKTTSAFDLIGEESQSALAFAVRHDNLEMAGQP